MIGLLAVEQGSGGVGAGRWVFACDARAIGGKGLFVQTMAK